MHPADQGDEGQGQTERPCSRCGGDLLLHWHGPLMKGVWMERCPACDAYRPAARAFIRWYRDTDRAPKALPPAVQGLGDRDYARPRLGPSTSARASRQPRSPTRPHTARTRLNPHASDVHPLRAARHGVVT
ncbi:DUF6300 family protein [Streptomyces massasporeus]